MHEAVQQALGLASGKHRLASKHTSLGEHRLDAKAQCPRRGQKDTKDTCRCRDLQRTREQVLRQQAAREAERSIIARCALRPSAADGAKCQTGDDDRRICGAALYAR